LRVPSRVRLEQPFELIQAKHLRESKQSIDREGPLPALDAGKVRWIDIGPRGDLAKSEAVRFSNGAKRWNRGGFDLRGHGLRGC